MTSGENLAVISIVAAFAVRADAQITKTKIIPDVDKYFFMPILFTGEVVYKYSLPTVFF